MRHLAHFFGAHSDQNMWRGVVKILTLPILQNFKPGEKCKLKIPGEYGVHYNWIEMSPKGKDMSVFYET